MLSIGFTEMPAAAYVVLWLPADFVAFFKTINDDSETSADCEPLFRVLALALEAADSVGLELEDIWLTAFLSKQLLMYGLLSALLTTFRPFLSLPPTEVDPSLLPPARLKGLWLVAFALEFDLAEVVESLLLTKLLILSTCTCDVEWCYTCNFGSALSVYSILPLAKSNYFANSLFNLSISCFF